MLDRDIDSLLIDRYGYPESSYIKEAFYCLANGLKTGAYEISERTDSKQLLLILCKELEGDNHEQRTN